MTTHGTGPRPREKAAMYIVMKISGKLLNTVPTSMFLSTARKQSAMHAELNVIRIAEINSNIRRPVLSINVSVTNVAISYKTIMQLIEKHFFYITLYAFIL